MGCVGSICFWPKVLVFVKEDKSLDKSKLGMPYIVFAFKSGKVGFLLISISFPILTRILLSICPKLFPLLIFPKLIGMDVIILFSLFSLFTHPLSVVVIVFETLFYNWIPDPPFIPLIKVSLAFPLIPNFTSF